MSAPPREPTLSRARTSDKARTDLTHDPELSEIHVAGIETDEVTLVWETALRSYCIEPQANEISRATGPQPCYQLTPIKLA